MRCRNISQSAKAKCTWKVTGQPGSVTAGAGGTNNCTELIDGVWSKTGTDKVTAKVTQSGKTTTDTVTVTVKASPGENDAVGVGSDTITPLTDQLATNYNSTVSASAASRSRPWPATRCPGPPRRSTRSRPRR
jgi:hypothetical protein